MTSITDDVARTIIFTFTDDEWDLITWSMKAENYGNQCFNDMFKDCLKQRVVQRDVNEMEGRHVIFKSLSKADKAKVINLLANLANKQV